MPPLFFCNDMILMWLPAISVQRCDSKRVAISMGEVAERTDRSEGKRSGVARRRSEAPAW